MGQREAVWQRRNMNVFSVEQRLTTWQFVAFIETLKNGEKLQNHFRFEMKNCEQI